MFTEERIRANVTLKRESRDNFMMEKSPLRCERRVVLLIPIDVAGDDAS